VSGSANGGAASVPLWIIGGFLGSGKTTVLNHLLGELAPTPVGVLLNDFGKIGVDVHLVEADEAITVTEVNGGQIFCSCVSGSFVERLRELAATPAKAVLVEASGLAKPGALEPILAEAQTAEGERLRYAGMVTVVDARAFGKLRHTVNAVSEQVVYADLLVVNKCDAASPEQIEEVDAVLGELNPGARVLHVEYGRVSPKELPGAPTAALRRSGPDGTWYEGWDGKKPVCRTWNPPPSLSRAELRAEVERRMHSAFRIKGFAETSEGPVFVSAASGGVEVEPVEEIRGEPGLTEFYPAGIDPDRLAEQQTRAGTRCR
jgi:G3E family GTPase